MDRGIRVLYVGEEPESAPRVGRELERASVRIDVVTAESAKEGLERLETGDAGFDCVLSGYELAGSDGLAFLRAVRETFQDIPFVLYTGEGTEAVASEAIAAGVTDYVLRVDEAGQFETLAQRIESCVAEYRDRQEAAEHADRLHELTSSTTDNFWIFDRDWEELYYISGYEEVWNRSTADIRENPQEFLESVHPDDREFVEENMARLSSGDSVDIEYRIQRGDGETGWVWVKGEPIFDDDGTVVRIAGFTRDVTERKSREKKLKQSKRRFEAMFNDPNILVGLVEPDGTVVDINQTALEYVDCELAALEGQPFWETPWFGGNDSLQEAVKEWIDRAASGEYVEFEMDLSAGVDEELVVSGGIRPVTDERGDIVSLLISDRDITERKKRERELEVRNQAINEAPVGMVITDPEQEDNPIIYTNDHFVEMIGYSREEIYGENCRFLQGEKTRDEQVARLRRAIDAEEPITVELRNYRKDGSLFWNRLSVAPVYDEDGTVTNYIGFQEDITDRKQRQRQLNVVDRVLRHNLRNDMNVIRNHAERLQSRDEADIRKTATSIVEKIDELMATTEKERLLAQHLSDPVEHRSVELCPLLQRIVSRFQNNHPQAVLTVDCSPAESCTVSRRISHAIEELIENALQHHDSPTPTIDVTVGSTPEFSWITVADDGPAIPEMERNVLLGHEETPLYHGSGFGLWLVYIITSQVDGTVTYEPNEPRGNRISIRIPR